MLPTVNLESKLQNSIGEGRTDEKQLDTTMSWLAKLLARLKMPRLWLLEGKDFFVPTIASRGILLENIAESHQFLKCCHSINGSCPLSINSMVLTTMKVFFSATRRSRSDVSE